MDRNEQVEESVAATSSAGDCGVFQQPLSEWEAGAEAVDHLAEQLGSPDEALAACAADAILALDPQAAQPLLARLLRQGRMPCSARAAALLGRLADPDSLDLLTETAASRRHPAAKAAHAALCSLAAPASVPYFCSRLVEPGVLEALEQLRDPRTIPALAAALQRGAAPAESRARMVGILQQVGGPAAIKALAQGSAEEPERVREARLEALAASSPQAAAALVEGLGQAGGRGDFACLALQHLGPQVAPLLLKATANTQPARQMRIAMLLGDLEAEGAGSALAELAAIGNAGVRREAARSLGRLGDRTAIPALESLLTDRNPGVRAQAAISLGRLGHIESAMAGPLITGLEFGAMRADAVEMLELMVYRAPCDHLRSAVRPLRVLSRPWSHLPAEQRQQCRALIEQIEQQTAMADEAEPEAEAEETHLREVLQV